MEKLLGKKFCNFFFKNMFTCIIIIWIRIHISNCVFALRALSVKYVFPAPFLPFRTWCRSYLYSNVLCRGSSIPSYTRTGLYNICSILGYIPFYIYCIRTYISFHEYFLGADVRRGKWTYPLGAFYVLWVKASDRTSYIYFIYSISYSRFHRTYFWRIDFL